MTRTKKPKWTPGPWRKTSGSIGGLIISTKTGISISNILFTGNTEECIANANLIASAPEMYEALMEVLAFLDGDAHCLDLIYTIQAALKKARGIKSE